MNMKIVSMGLAMSIAAAGACADPFLFQGQLKVSGEPANGVFDLNFVLKDSTVGGSTIGTPFSADDVLVEDGLFSVEMDFFTPFTAEDHWIEILVRDGDSADPFTVLSPRQPIVATPKAQHAVTAETVLNPAWYLQGDDLRHGEGFDKVRINRDSSISGADYFTVHADVDGFVGMYTSGLKGSMPFYGYSVDGDISAYTTYQSLTSSWRLYSNNAERLVVNSFGELEVFNHVIASGSVVADAFVYNSPKTHKIAISAKEFSPGRDVPYRSGSSGALGAYIEQNTAESLLASIPLPDGAVMTKMTAYCSDTYNSGSMTVRLQAFGHGANVLSTVFAVDTFGMTGSSIVLEDTTPNELNNLNRINYETHHYILDVIGQVWPGNQTMSIGSVVIEYTVDEAD